MQTRSMTVGLISVLGMTLALVTSLQAFSVGDLVVQSPRGAPLLAEVPLKLDPQERDRGVVVALGDREDYQAEGLPRAAVIDHLDVSWHPGARDTVRITSNIPMQTPAFALVLLVRVGQITIVRTYHVAVPAPPAAPRTAAHAAPPPRSTPQHGSPAPTTPSIPHHTARMPVGPSWLQRLPKRYGPVEQATTLYSIVRGLGVPGQALWQTLVLIWQANTPQFAGGNLHGLRAGASLAIPSDLAAGIAAMRTEDAQHLVAAQWEAWHAFRRAVSDQQHVVPFQTDTVGLAAQLVSPAPVGLPAAHASPPAGVAGVQSVLQHLEEFLAQRLPQAKDAADPVAFVSAMEVQEVVHGLEERLTQRVHETLRQIAAAPQAAPRARQAAGEQPMLLEHVGPLRVLVSVLVVENALLCFLAGGILWRWSRRRT